MTEPRTESESRSGFVPAEVTETAVRLKTYPRLPHAELPSLFSEGWPRNIYPYARRECQWDHSEMRRWRLVRLANEYLEVDVLPELGGHVWGARDKVQNAEVFHRVDAIKPSGLGIAGTWVATGIEFNFPVTHSILTMDEVIETHGTDPDGSAWVCIGATDKLYGLRWQFHIRLRPGQRALEITGWLHNPTELEHPWCYWGNAGVTTHESLRLYYPFRWAEHHGGRQFPWPFQHGSDLSYWRELPEPVSVFGDTGDARWFGAYYDEFDRGVVHTADPDVVPGKKYFSWGCGRAGERWAGILSDNNTGYVELQAGSRNDQEFWNVLRPHETVRFREFWQPVDGLGGLTAANERVAVHLERSDDGAAATLRAQPSAQLDGVRFLARAGGRTLDEWQADLKPDQVHERTISCAEKLVVEVLPADGVLPLEIVERDVADVGPRPPSREELLDPTEVSARAFRREALRAAQRTNWSRAQVYFEAALELEPDNLEALREVGLFRLRRFEYAGAAEILHRAVEAGVRETSTAWALWWSRYQTESDAPLAELAEDLLAEHDDLRRYAHGLLALRAGRAEEALAEFAARPLRERLRNRDLCVMQLVAARLAGKPDAELLELMRQQFPTDGLVAREQARQALDAILDVDADAGVSVAGEYAKLSDFHTARDVVTQVAKRERWKLSLRILAAYLSRRMKDDRAATKHLEAQVEFDGVSDRPWQEIFYDAMPWALKHCGVDPRLRLLWGNLQMRVGREDEALDAWKCAARQGGEWPALHFGIALLESRRGGATDEAVARMKELVASSGDKLEYLGPYLSVLRLSGRREETLRELAARKDDPAFSEHIPVSYAMELATTGEVDEALEHMLNTRFPPTHGSGTLSYAHLDLRRLRAERLMDKGDFDAARAELAAAEVVQHNFREDTQVLKFKAPIHVSRGLLEEKAGNPEAARAAFEAALAEEHGMGGKLKLYQAWAMLKLGRTREGEQIIERTERMAHAHLKIEQPGRAHFLNLLAVIAKIRGDTAGNERYTREAIREGYINDAWS